MRLTGSLLPRHTFQTLPVHNHYSYCSFVLITRKQMQMAQTQTLHPEPLIIRIGYGRRESENLDTV